MARRLVLCVMVAALGCAGTAPEVRRAAERGDIPNALRLYQRYVSDRGAGNADLLSVVALGVLREAAGSGDAHTRAAGFSALRMLGIRARPALEILTQRPGVVGDWAAGALFDLDGSDGSPPPRLAAALASDDVERKVAGIASLGAHDLPALVALLSEHHSMLRRAAAQRLGHVRAPGALQALVTCARSDADASVRAAAVRSLGAHGPAAATALVGALTDPDMVVRLNTPSALMNASPEDATEALSALVTGDPTDLSLEAARVLALHGDQHSVAFILAALSSVRPEIRSQAAVGAGVLPSSESTQLAGHLHDDDAEVVLRLAAVLLRHAAYRDQALAALHPLAASPEGFLAIRALQALASAGDSSAAEPIREALAVADANVRRIAVLAWPSVAEASGNVDPLLPLLTDPDRSVELMAAAEIILIAGR